MMQKLKINLENCYGIKKFTPDFYFSEKYHTCVIYASNGSMKTSFAKVFHRLQSGTEKDLDDIKDHIFGREQSIFDIKVDDAPIEKEEIYVVKSLESFLLVGPQRLMSSSMPAALQFWQEKKKLL